MQGILWIQVCLPAKLILIANGTSLKKKCFNVATNKPRKPLKICAATNSPTLETVSSTTGSPNTPPPTLEPTNLPTEPLVPTTAQPTQSHQLSRKHANTMPSSQDVPLTMVIHRLLQLRQMETACCSRELSGMEISRMMKTMYMGEVHMDQAPLSVPSTSPPAM